MQGKKACTAKMSHVYATRMEKYGSIYLIQITSEKPFYFAFKTRIENRKGDVNAW